MRDQKCSTLMNFTSVMWFILRDKVNVLGSCLYIVDTFDFIVFPVVNTAFVDCAIENSVTF